MKILENDHQRAIRTHCFHQIAKFAQHPFSCGPEHFVLESYSVSLLEEIGHLEQPGWRIGPNCLQSNQSVWTATTSYQCIDQWEEGFVSPEALRAAPAQGDHAVLGKTFQGHLDKRGLAYSCLARDEDDLPLAGEHLLSRTVQSFQWSSSSNPPTVGGMSFNRYVLSGLSQSFDDLCVLSFYERAVGA